MREFGGRGDKMKRRPVPPATARGARRRAKAQTQAQGGGGSPPPPAATTRTSTYGDCRDHVDSLLTIIQFIGLTAPQLRGRRG